MSEVAIIGIDVAKRVFQLQGARDDGSAVLRKQLSRGQVLAFVSRQSRCVVAMEACATAHGWGREFEKLGHSVRLIPPIYVQPSTASVQFAQPRPAAGGVVTRSGWGLMSAGGLR